MSGRAKSACSYCSGLTCTACRARLRCTRRTRRYRHDQQHSPAAALSACALTHAQCNHTRRTRWVERGAIARDAHKALAWCARCDIWRSEAHTGAGLHARTGTPVGARRGAASTRRAGLARVPDRARTADLHLARHHTLALPLHRHTRLQGGHTNSYTRSNSLHGHK